MSESEAVSIAKRIQVSELADSVMDMLNEYADTTADDMKQTVKSAGKTVKDEIKNHAPQDTGKYAKSWSVKNMGETAHSIQVIVHSRNRYQIAHLLEHGHAKRGGGRVAARPHIAAAEEVGEEQLEREIERSLRYG